MILSLLAVSGYSRSEQVEKKEPIEFTLVLNGSPTDGWFLVPYRDGLKVTLGTSGYNMRGNRSDSPPPFAGLWHGSLEPSDNPVYRYYRSKLTLGHDGSASFIEHMFDTPEGVDRTTEAGRDAPFDKKLVVELAGRWVRHRKREGKALLKLRVRRQADANTKWWNTLRKRGQAPKAVL